MKILFCPPTQVLKHDLPSFPSGKQSVSFRDLLCFPFTGPDKDHTNQGLFVEGQKERKKENDYNF